MSELESVWLNLIDGFEFEKLCARILDKLGYGNVEDIQDVADEGRDLIIHAPNGQMTVVECKHWPKGTVGRPVIQKLHSAVLTSGGSKGLLMTSGKFSKEALIHAQKLTPPIELVDRGLLIDMAFRAGIRLISAGEELAVFTFGISDMEWLNKKLAQHVYHKMISVPTVAEKLLAIGRDFLEVKPAYRLVYSIHQDFSTSVGTIYSIHRDRESLMLDGNTGELVDRSISSFFAEEQLKPIEQSFPKHLSPVLPKFDLGTSQLNKLAKETIAHINTASVTYHGKTRRTYAMTCRPSERDIVIEDIRQVYIPFRSIGLTACQKTYKTRFMENVQGFYMLSNDLSICQICARPIGERSFLCNSCGNIAHKPNFITHHSFVCRLCRKTICRECAYWVPRWFFFKKVVCEACAEMMQEQTHKPKRKLATKIGG